MNDDQKKEQEEEIQVQPQMSLDPRSIFFREVQSFFMVLVATRETLTDATVTRAETSILIGAMKRMNSSRICDATVITVTSEQLRM